MRLTQLALEGAYVIESAPFWDERGYFARVWSARHKAD